MYRLTHANFSRLWKTHAFGLFIAAMLFLSSGFMVMQATAMDYTVPLSRVIFLPLSFYGVTAAAFVSVFTGADFSDGFVRSKLLAAENRRDFVFSHILVSCAACILVYVISSLFTLCTGIFFFENNVEINIFIKYFMIGIGMSAAYGCIFCVITLLCKNRITAVIWCMGIAFFMLFLSLHTHQFLVQTEYKNGVLNPHYIDGFRRILYSLLHDLNPCGQAAQLSAWEVWNPIRASVCNFIWIVSTAVTGCWLFSKKDIK